MKNSELKSKMDKIQFAYALIIEEIEKNGYAPVGKILKSIGIGNQYGTTMVKLGLLETYGRKTIKANYNELSNKLARDVVMHAHKVYEAKWKKFNSKKKDQPFQVKLQPSRNIKLEINEEPAKIIHRRKRKPVINSEARIFELRLFGFSFIKVIR